MSLSNFTIVLIDAGTQNLAIARDTLLGAFDIGRSRIAAYTRPGVPQLFGSVYSIIQGGPGVTGAYLARGAADLIIGFEIMETLRACIGDETISLPALGSSEKTEVVCLRRKAPPVGRGEQSYPEQESLEKAIAARSRTATFLDYSCDCTDKQAPTANELVSYVLGRTRDLLPAGTWCPKRLSRAIDALKL